MNLLFFTPHVAIWPHTAPEAYLARGLSECGHSIRYLTCGKAQTYCAAMTARRLSPGDAPTLAKRACADCGAGAKAIASVYGFPLDTLRNHLDASDIASLDAIASDAVSNKSLDTEFLGVKIGRLALYEFTLTHKKMSVELTREQWTEYGVYLVNALRSLLGFDRYLALNRPDLIFSFSPQYSNINPCMQRAIDKGIRTFFIESGTNLSHRLGTMRVWDWSTHKLVNPALSYWRASDANPVTQIGADKVVGHFEQLLSGHHFAVFSSPYSGNMGIRDAWGISPTQKILLMTLSSYDEAYAALLIGGFPTRKVFSNVFRTQADWIKATVAWAANRPDVFVIVRVHPRDFPNKRESMRSEQSFMLEGLLTDLPENVRVNWPGEGVSLYALLEDADAILTGWSVTAMEALSLGIPVVTYDANLPAYPSDIHYTGRSETEYFLNIERALSDGWRLENAINGFRWLAHLFVNCTITVAERFGQFELGPQSPIARLWSRILSRMPRLRASLDLLKWRAALPGARIVSCMVMQGHDAIPPARASTERVRLPDPTGERAIVVQALSRVQALLYADKPPSVDKPGLSRNLRHVTMNKTSR